MAAEETTGLRPPVKDEAGDAAAGDWPAADPASSRGIKTLNAEPLAGVG
jgi:hypothetical protein